MSVYECLCSCYRIMRTPWQMSLEKVRHVLREALQVWSDITPLIFTEVTSGRADIMIDFNRYKKYIFTVYCVCYAFKGVLTYI